MREKVISVWRIFGYFCLFPFPICGPHSPKFWSVRETGFFKPRNTKPPLSHSRIWTGRLYFIPSNVVVRGEGLIYWAVKFAIWQTASSRLKAKGGKREKRDFFVRPLHGQTNSRLSKMDAKEKEGKKGNNKAIAHDTGVKKGFSGHNWLSNRGTAVSQVFSSFFVGLVIFCFFAASVFFFGGKGAFLIIRWEEKMICGIIVSCFLRFLVQTMKDFPNSEQNTTCVKSRKS